MPIEGKFDDFLENVSIFETASGAAIKKLSACEYLLSQNPGKPSLILLLSFVD